MFKTELKVIKLLDDQWKLLCPLIYEHPNKTETLVPAGFVTDFASVPGFAMPLTGGSDGNFTKAAVLHDYLYKEGHTDRSTADLIFKRAMKELGVPWWRRNLMYLGVKIWGWNAWNKYRNNATN